MPQIAGPLVQRLSSLLASPDGVCTAVFTQFTQLLSVIRPPRHTLESRRLEASRAG